MSMHKKPLTLLERAGLEAHGLDIGTPSQLSDAFRQGIAYALESVAPAAVDFNLDVDLPPHKISDQRYSETVKVSFDAAEGDGRVWFMDPNDNWVAIEGEANAREAARLLLAWADTYAKGGEQ